MSDNLGHGQWIAIAWGQVALAYVVYLLYLRGSSAASAKELTIDEE